MTIRAWILRYALEDTEMSPTAVVFFDERVGGASERPPGVFVEVLICPVADADPESLKAYEGDNLVIPAPEGGET